MDVLSPEQRRRTMAAVKGRDTTPELIVRNMLHKAGFRFRLHRKDLPGSPDIVLPKYQIVIFVHGCFWHQHRGCKGAERPISNRDYWQSKLDRNMARDEKNAAKLRELGWKPVVIWECETKNKMLLAEKINNFFAKQGALPTCSSAAGISKSG